MLKNIRIQASSYEDMFKLSQWQAGWRVPLPRHMYICMHVQIDGQPPNIMPLAPYIGWTEA